MALHLPRLGHSDQSRATCRLLHLPTIVCYGSPVAHATVVQVNLPTGPAVDTGAGTPSGTDTGGPREVVPSLALKVAPSHWRAALERALGRLGTPSPGSMIAPGLAWARASPVRRDALEGTGGAVARQRASSWDSS